ncbi:MAG: IS4 family transposase [Acidobacteria bacterium]|nr:MAG: IS4 family transposase [Acidobacteriota bacterium]
MYKVCSIFSQVLRLFSRGEFEKAVKEHKAERHARGFTSWGQFMAMLFCQLGRAHSLREICGGLACCEGQLKHLGVPVAPKKSTLAYANEHRPWQLYQAVFEQTLGKCRELVASQGGRKKKFRFKNKLMSLDGSIIDLSVSMFDWAKFRQTKGAIKLHLLLDHDGYLPSFGVVTEGKTSEIKVARTLRFDPGTILAIDRGYVDYEWFRELTQEEVYFVTRMKEKAVYEVKAELEVPKDRNVLSDQIIYFPRLRREGEEPVLFRRVEIWDEKKQEPIVFLTNLLEFGATTIAAIYKDRWQVELFFKALKQTLKVKTFVGTSANAVKTQVWTALIAMLVLKYLQLKSKFSWSLSNLAALLRQQLFFYRDLYVWLDDPYQAPPALVGLHDNAQLSLAITW